MLNESTDNQYKTIETFCWFMTSIVRFHQILSLLDLIGKCKKDDIYDPETYLSCAYLASAHN